MMKKSLFGVIFAAVAATAGLAEADRLNDFQLRNRLQALNDDCRRRSENCIERDIVYDELVARGWCWGEPEQAEADKEWYWCKPVEGLSELDARIAAVRKDLPQHFSSYADMIDLYRIDSMVVIVFKVLNPGTVAPIQCNNELQTYFKQKYGLGSAVHFQDATGHALFSMNCP